MRQHYLERRGSKTLALGALERKRTDAELMGLLASGEMEPLGELYMRYGSSVRTLLWRVLAKGQAEDAEDLCQEVFVTLYKTAGRFQPDRELRPWLFGIAVRKARAWQRKMLVRGALLRRYAHESKPVQPGHSGASTATRYQIEQAIAKLPQAQREILVLNVAHGMSREQIADTLGVKLNTVWTRLRRARLAMRSRLGETQSDTKSGVR